MTLIFPHDGLSLNVMSASVGCVPRALMVRRTHLTLYICDALYNRGNEKCQECLLKNYGIIIMNFDYPPGATPLDPDELDGLRLSHITNRAELDRC